MRPVFAKPAAKAALPVASAPDVDRAQATIVADLSARRAAKPVTDEGPRERFRRALELERAEQAGSVLTPEQQRWLNGFQSTPDYRAERMLWDEMGDAIFG